MVRTDERMGGEDYDSLLSIKDLFVDDCRLRIDWDRIKTY